jgi:hypothetical protein
MATNIYEYDTVDPSLLGWNTLLSNNFTKAELYNHTYLRYQVASGEVAVSGEIANLYKNTWRKAYADGVKQPVAGIFLESGVSGEWVRVRTLGPLTSNDFNFLGSGEYIYLGVSGELTASVPASNPEVVGYALGNKELFIRPQYLNPATAIANGSITFVKIQDVTTARVLGRKTASPGAIEELDTDDVKNLTNIIHHDETANRDFGQIYQNTTGRTMRVTAIGWADTNSSSFIGYVSTTTPPTGLLHWVTKNANERHTVILDVPNNSYYKILVSGGAVAKDGWDEAY